MTQTILPFDAEIIEAPARETYPVILRQLTTKIVKCRFCGAVCQRRDSRRKYLDAWRGAHWMDTRIGAALREQNLAATVALDMLFAHVGGVGQ
jgi:hypothetical protein